MTTKWIYKQTDNQDAVEQLSSSINVNPTVASILVQRGIHDFESAKRYFRPDLDQLHDPFMLKDMTKAIKRLNNAVANREKILIYGDYDVDGTTAVALVYGFLSHFYDNICYYIPDRYAEGYGVSRQGIEWAAENDCALMITLDCGIKAIEMSNLAREHNIDMIICDHHLPGDQLPGAFAILDPKQHDCPYPFKELSGCGLGFKLIQAFCITNHYDPDLMFDFLDLVAISIAADIVPVIGENRIMTYYGLKKLNENPRPGIRAIIDSAGLRGDIDIGNIVFGIGPRINASGRIDHAKTAVALLLEQDVHVARSYAENLDGFNTTRRTFDQNITSEALAMIEEDEEFQQAKSTVLFKKDWHKGVIGIVASRCLDKFYRPTIILTQSNGKATGSARSVTGFDIYKAISQCSDLLDQFGGHAYAAGLTMDPQKIDLFRKRFEEVVASSIQEDQLIPQIEIDAEISLPDINYKFYNLLKQMAPFGPGNMQPVFVSENLKVKGYPRVLKNQHLKFSVYQDDDESVCFDVIAFGMADYADLVGSGMRFKMVYYVEENNFMDNSTLQLRAKDLKFD